MSKDADKPQKKGKAFQKSNRDRKVEVALTESQRAQKREEIIREIRGSFSVFGHEVAAFMVGHYLRFGNLKSICQDLHLNQPSDIEDQCAVILQYVEEGGTRSVLKQLSTQKKTADSDPESAKKSEIDDILADAESVLIDQVMKESSRRRESNINYEQTKVGTEIKPNQNDEIEADDDIIIDEETGRPMKDGKFIERRSGVERRSEEDRRQSEDRRKSVETIFKNRRYGKDRRSGIERRSGKDRRSSNT